MDPMPMILPKGIVKNTDAIYTALASFSVVPPEILWGCWHVYTYTSRRLSDPTAHRLENFWWHVLGSNRRYLSGKVLAKIFEEISNGPTFVPLKGPANRYEGPPVPKFSQHELDNMLSGSNARPSHSQDRGQGRKPASPTKGAPKELASSAMKPVPLHPILKNARGPSSSGPRPTARFVSPPDSGDESDDDEQAASGGRSALEMRSQQAAATSRSEKKATQGGKKFIAATAAAKRRPVLPRRPSSQSSTSSETGSKEGGSGSSTKHVSGHRLSPNTAEQQSKSPRRSPGASTLTAGPVLSAKAAGKQPAMTISEEAEEEENEKEGSRHEGNAVGKQQGIATREKAGRGNSDLAVQPKAGMARDEPRRTSPGVVASHIMARSQSDIGTRSPSQQSAAGRQPPSGKAASSVVATSTVAAQGHFDFEHPAPAEASLEPRDIPDQLSISSRRSSKPLFAPTQPSPTPDVPLARSKSQLAILLELDKDRNGSPNHQGQNRNGKE